MEKELKKKTVKPKTEKDGAEKPKKGAKKEKPSSSSTKDVKKSKGEAQKAKLDIEDEEYKIEVDENAEDSDMSADSLNIIDEDEESPIQKKTKKATKKPKIGQEENVEETGDKGIIIQYLKSVSLYKQRQIDHIV